MYGDLDYALRAHLHEIMQKYFNKYPRKNVPMKIDAHDPANGEAIPAAGARDGAWEGEPVAVLRTHSVALAACFPNVSSPYYSPLKLSRSPNA